MDKNNGVSLVVTTEAHKPLPPPKKVYVLTLDEEHAVFLLSLVSRVQVVNEAGGDSFDIYQALSGRVGSRGLRVFQEGQFNNLELAYIEEER